MNSFIKIFLTCLVGMIIALTIYTFCIALAEQYPMFIIGFVIMAICCVWGAAKDQYKENLRVNSLQDKLRSAKESYDMTISQNSPLSELAKDTVKGFFTTVKW